MRLVGCMLFAALLAATANGVTVPPLPAPEFADTEVSTNLPISVSFDAMSRMAFTLSLDASPSNCVEVAVGTDADGDGALSALESAYAFGYDCGFWFVRDAALDAETREADGADRARVPPAQTPAGRRLEPPARRAARELRRRRGGSRRGS